MFNYSKAQFTDDTGQALVLLDSLKEKDYKPDAADIATRMLVWAEKENAFENNILGPTSKVALADFRDGRDASAITNKALSNGSSMRIAPIGCLFTPEQRQDIGGKIYDLKKSWSNPAFLLLFTLQCDQQRLQPMKSASSRLGL